MKKILILGGSGLIGSNLAVHLTEMVGYEVFCADLAKTRSKELEGVTFIKVNALQKGRITSLIDEIRPSIVINGINVATIFSHNPKKGYAELIGFYLDLYKGLSLLEHPVHYIQLGTTGSGGLGLNIPFTHGDKIEELPIIHKAAFAGVTTSMLTLLSRSLVDSSRVSEIKPGLAIFEDHLKEERMGDSKVVLLNGGESGDYTYDELALLTCFMGFTTVSKIVDKVIGIISGERVEKTASPYDVIEAMNATIISSESDDYTERNGFLAKMRDSAGANHVIATGNLGPPSLTRDLILAYVKIHKIPTDPRNFSSTLTAAPSLRDTMAYIRMHNPKLHKYLVKECTVDNYYRLGEFGILGMDQPWQLVRARLAAKR